MIQSINSRINGPPIRSGVIAWVRTRQASHAWVLYGLLFMTFTITTATGTHNEIMAIPIRFDTISTKPFPAAALGTYPYSAHVIQLIRVSIKFSPNIREVGRIH